MGLFFLMNNAALALRGPLLDPAHVGPRHPLRRLERHLARRADAGALRARGYLDLGEGACRQRHRPARTATTSTASSACCPTLACPSSSASGSVRSPASPDIRVRLGRVASNGDGPAIRYREGRLGLRAVDRARRADRGDGLAAGRSVASRALHERRRADPALDVRRARLRARPRRVPGQGRTTRSW